MAKLLVLSVLSHQALWLAQAAICLPFVVSALMKSVNREAALKEMAAGGLPRSTTLLGTVVLVQAAAVLLILTGLSPVGGALLLIGFMTVATVKYHAFWLVRGAPRLVKVNHFAENVALIGALVLIALIGVQP